MRNNGAKTYEVQPRKFFISVGNKRAVGFN